MSSEADKVRRAMLEDAADEANITVRPQRRNANRHTARGMQALEKSIEQDGWIGAVTVAADGETFDGSARVEKTAENGMLDDPIVLDIDGTVRGLTQSLVATERAIWDVYSACCSSRSFSPCPRSRKRLAATFQERSKTPRGRFPGWRLRSRAWTPV